MGGWEPEVQGDHRGRRLLLLAARLDSHTATPQNARVSDIVGVRLYYEQTPSFRHHHMFMKNYHCTEQLHRTDPVHQTFTNVCPELIFELSSLVGISNQSNLM